MDFVSDSLVNGRRLKLLTVADDFTRACVDIAADYGISGQYVTRPARPGGTVRRLPQCGAHRQRTGVHQPRLHGLGAGQGDPASADRTRQADAKRLHRELQGKLRDECLNEQWFETLHQAQSTIAAWRRDYNEVRPHSSLGRIPPALRRAAPPARRRCCSNSKRQNRPHQLTSQPGLPPIDWYAGRVRSLTLVRGYGLKQRYTLGSV